MSLRYQHLVPALLAAFVVLASPAKAIDFADMKCGRLNQAACSVAPASYEGRKPSGCPGGTFFDLIDGGSCWSCPSGTVRNVTAVNSASACLRPPGETVRKATRHGRGTGLLGTDCPKGQFWDPNGSCWSCPSGFTRTAAPVTAKNACTKWRGPSTARATKRKSLACGAGEFADPSGGGTCWSCPSGYVRTLAAVSAPNACAARDLIAGASPLLGLCADGLVNSGGRCVERDRCGALGQRPCLIVERIPSCDAGLAEDFLQNRCVEDRLAEVACKGLVNAFWAGREIAALTSQVTSPAFLQRKLMELNGGMAVVEEKKAALQQRVAGELKTLVNRHAPEVEPIVAWLEDPRNQGKVSDLFSADNVCSGDIADMDSNLRRLGLVPATFLAEVEKEANFSATGVIFGALAGALGIEVAHADQFDPIPLADPLWRHAFLGYQITLAGAKGVGGGLSIMGVTDLRGNGGFYISPLLQGVTNVGGGVDARLVLFTSANMNTFEGLGYGVGATVPSPKGGQAINLGVDLYIEPPFVLRGFGLGGGAGKSALPADVAISGAYAFQLSRYCATTPERQCGGCSCLN